METSLQRVWQLYRFRRYPLALEETVKFLGQYPESAEAFCLAALIHGKEKRLQEATEAAESAITYAPDWSYPHYVHALVAYWNKKYDLALRSLSEALRIKPNDPDVYQLVSAIHADEGHVEASFQMAERGLQNDPQHVGCLYLRAVSLYSQKKMSEAESSFRSILSIDPEHPHTCGFVGHFEIQKGNYQKALPLLRNALREDPDWELAQAAWRVLLTTDPELRRSFTRPIDWKEKLKEFRNFFYIFVGIILGMLIMALTSKSKP